MISVITSVDDLADELSEGMEGTIIVDQTPFYATMGGQQGDTGIITAGTAKFDVVDTIRLKGGRVGHFGKVVSGSFKVGDKVSLSVNEELRADTCKNHSATHLLQEALRIVLGGHVEQAGSLVTPDRLRFDFTHFNAMTAEEINKVETIVNEKISENLIVETKVLPIEEAKKTGAKALFGEKYGETVRVVCMDEFSKEFCGGTHVGNTGVIGSIKIISETGVAAGVRRIEALTGKAVFDYYKNIEHRFNEVCKLLKANSNNVEDKITHLYADIKLLQSENESLKSKAANEAMGNVLDKVIDVNGVKYLGISVDDVEMNELRNLGDELKAKLGSGVIFIASKCGERVNLMITATDDVVSKGVHAGNIIKTVAPVVGGKGGGRPNMAQAGGNNAAMINEAIEAAKKTLADQL